MPKLASFLGIYIYMFYLNGYRHHEPHIHAEYAEHSAVFSIRSGMLLSGDFPDRQKRKVSAWIEIYREELETRWSYAIQCPRRAGEVRRSETGHREAPA